MAQSITGLQVAVVAGVSDIVRGVQLGGLAVGAGDMRGVQLALFGPAAETARGFQAGILGSAAEELRGVQLGGHHCHVEGHARGLQIALWNYCEELTGVQIGLINVSRKHRWPVIPLVNIRRGLKDHPAKETR